MFVTAVVFVVCDCGVGLCVSKKSSLCLFVLLHRNPIFYLYSSLNCMSMSVTIFYHHQGRCSSIRIVGGDCVSDVCMGGKIKGAFMELHSHQLHV
jgi:hypothetical protein